MKIVTRAMKTSCIIAAAWCALTSQVARAQVLQQVPSDALVVIKVNHLQDTNTKVSNLLTSLGLTDLVPQLKDPLAAAETQLGIGPGFDLKRDAAGVLINGTFDKDQPPPFVLLLPVSDYKAFLGSTKVVRTEGDVSVVNFKDNEDEIFVENWGDYAAISDKKDNVTGKHEGLKLTGELAKQMDSQDECAFVNFPVLKGILQPQIKELVERLTNKLTESQKDPNKLKVTETAISQGVNVINEFLNDATGATIGLSLGSEGVHENLIVELTPDSYLGKLTTSMKNTDQSLLGGLPKENYIFFGGSVEDPNVVTKAVNDAINPLVDQLGTLGDDGKKLADAINSAKDYLATVQGGSIGLIAPTAALGQGSLVRLIATYKADSQKALDLQTKTADLQGLLGKLIGLPGADLMKTTVTPDAKTVNGVKFYKMTQEVNPDNTSQEAMRASEMLSQIYGPDGVTVYTGAVDSKTLVQSLGNDDDLIGEAINAAKNNTDVLTPDLKSVDGALPKQRFAVAYFGLGQLINTALSYAKANGMNMQVQLPNNLPPIATSAGTDGPTIHGDLFIPTRLMQSLVQAGMQVYMQFNNHGGNGGGGL